MTALASPAPAAHAAPEATGIVQAADLSKFSPGNIVSDAVFFAPDTMSSGAIQSFLNGKVASCKAGFTCLKDYRQATTTRPADAYCNGYTGASNETAAEIIRKVAISCGVNPQALLVTLQKEQGLVTSREPSATRYRIAMGFACPDTAACDTRYYGFHNQVYSAARQFQLYRASSYFTWYAPGKTWNILFHPDSARGCGTSPVHIANDATAGLYYYTPYQPNAAALRAGYGEGDRCSSYGNRNFYNYFTDWFGSTQVLPTPAGVFDSVEMATATALWAVDREGVLWAYPSAGATAWKPRAQVATGWGTRTHLLSVGDMDGDGLRDLIAADAGRVQLHRGSADGLEAPIDLGLTWEPGTLAAAVGDMSGDGIPDIVSVDPGGRLLLHRGDGGNGLRAPIAVGTGWNSMNMLIGVGDIDGDGCADLGARRADGRLLAYTGDCYGGWRQVLTLGRGWNGMTSILSSGALYGKTRDLHAIDAGGGLWLYSVENGTVFNGEKVGRGWAGMVHAAGAGEPAGGSRVAAPGSGDLDGNLRPDVLAVQRDGRLRLYSGDGAGGWRTNTLVEGVDATDSRIVPLGDFDGDGNRDLGMVDATGGFSVLAGDGAGGFSAARQVGRGWRSFDLVVGSVDVDGDGATDVLARTSAGDLLLYAGDGRGGWKTGTGSSVGDGWGPAVDIIPVGDFDGDGSPDLLVRWEDGTLRQYPVVSDGLGEHRVVGKGWRAMTALLSVGDFDGRGGPDLLARTAAGDLLMYRTDGAGNWTSSIRIGVRWNGVTWLG